MSSKTPKFDVALDAILNDLKPHTRVCTETGETFEITERDIEMLKLLRVPPPTTVWWARHRQKSAHMAGIDLYRRVLVDGESVVTMFDPESFVKIMPRTEWHGDAFDASSFGRDIDPGTPFFAQFLELSKEVPRPSIFQDAKSENSEWSVYTIAYKDCYNCHVGIQSEGVMHSDAGSFLKASTDVSSVRRGELCYDDVNCRDCSRLAFSHLCENCLDVSFSLECKNCTDCFGCTNLRHKRFCFLNEQLSEEEYRERTAEIDLSDARVVEEWKERTAPLWDAAPHRAAVVMRSENAVGHEVEDSRDVEGRTVRNSERAYHGTASIDSCDLLDYASVVGMERSFNICRTMRGYENRNSLHCEECIDIDYCELLTACEHCFGCIGLKRKKFCAFNKQYTEEEYWPLVDSIKVAMLERGEYGEFFPYSSSLFAYDTSYAGFIAPLERAEAERLGSRWYDFPVAADDPAILSIERLPFRLTETGDDVLERQFRCPESGRPFRFVKPELEIHRTMGIALPRVHPSVRRKERSVAALYLARFYRRACGSCGESIVTIYPPDVPFPVYCQACFERLVVKDTAFPNA